VYPTPPADDPIHGIFDLADRAAAAAPRLLRISRATTILLAATLGIVAYLLFAVFATNLLSVILGVLTLAGGGVAILLMRENERFYGEYVERHRTILRLQDADPTPPVPEGRGPADRLLLHLRSTNARIERAVSRDPKVARFRVQASVGGSTRAFDLLLLAPHQRWSSGDGAGFAVLARVASSGIEADNVIQFAQDLAAVAPRLKEPLARAILLAPRGKSISVAAYEAARSKPIAAGGRAVPLELIAERPDGTYDLVPLLVDAP
jgi:hypothetical protein